MYVCFVLTINFKASMDFWLHEYSKYGLARRPLSLNVQIRYRGSTDRWAAAAGPSVGDSPSSARRELAAEPRLPLPHLPRHPEYIQPRSYNI